jgi:alpha/beta superfamily hydrolase
MRQGEVPRIETLEIQGPAGILEGVLRFPPGEVRLSALLCHPHPLYQGSMHSPVIFRAARALHRLGYATLRFNFRGVGRSAGSHDDGRGEKDDVRAALATLQARLPGVPETLLGYSFGSRVGFEAASASPLVDRLIGIGMPIALGPFDFLRESGKPLLAVQGERDEFGSPSDLARLIGELGPPSRLVVVSGADHLFGGKLAELEESLYAALAEGPFSGTSP